MMGGGAARLETAVQGDDDSKASKNIGKRYESIVDVNVVDLAT